MRPSRKLRSSRSWSVCGRATSHGMSATERCSSSRLPLEVAGVNWPPSISVASGGRMEGGRLWSSPARARRQPGCRSGQEFRRPSTGGLLLQGMGSNPEALPIPLPEQAARASREAADGVRHQVYRARLLPRIYTSRPSRSFNHRCLPAEWRQSGSCAGVRPAFFTCDYGKDLCPVREVGKCNEACFRLYVNGPKIMQQFVAG